MQEFMISVVSNYVSLTIGIVIGVIGMVFIQTNGPDDPV